MRAWRRVSGRGALVAVKLSILVLLVPIYSCSTGGDISPESLRAAIAAGNAPHILDVRTTGEYTAGHVPGAIHIPYQDVWLSRAELPAAKTDPIVVYCSHGPRASMAVFQLWTLGYENIVYLDGQMTGWKQEGLPLTTGPDP